MKIVVFTAIHKRRDLTEIFFKELTRQGLDVYCSYSDAEDYKLAKKYCKGVIGCPNNPVSNKFNSSLSLLRGVDFDYAMILGSDDFISDNFIDVIKEHLEGDYIAFNDIAFYRVQDGKQSYLKYGSCLTAPIGAGSFFSKRLLDKKNYKLWSEGLNSRLDSNRQNNLRGWDMKIVSMIDLGIEMVDVKFERNITNPNLVSVIEPYEINLIDTNIFRNLVPKDIDHIKSKNEIVMSKGNKRTFEIIKDHLDLKKGAVYNLSVAVGRGLELRGIAKCIDSDVKTDKKAPKKASKKVEDKKEKTLEDMSLKELRELHPDIKSNSKGKFIQKVQESQSDCEGCDDGEPCKDCEKSAETTNIPNRD